MSFMLRALAASLAETDHDSDDDVVVAAVVGWRLGQEERELVVSMYHRSRRRQPLAA